jgi:sugar lactone lactonase YvrE
VALDGAGNLYIADIGNAVVRRVVLGTGIITTYAGKPGTPGFPTNNVAATSSLLNGPIALAVDAGGNLFIADQNADVVCRVDATTKILTIVAGTGTLGFSGDGGLATLADLQVPEGVAVDSAGNLYIADSENARIREVFSPTNPNTPNQITTIVGSGTFGFNGDGAAGTATELTNPFGIFVDPTTRDLWIADFWSDRVRLYTASTKIVTTVVGSGAVGDGGTATGSGVSLYYPRNPALDSSGDLFLVDAQNNRIREVSAADQTISTVVGTGIPCARPALSCGDGGPAASASLFMPRTVTVEPSGILIVADNGDNRIREVDAGGTITTIAGSGNLCASPFSTCGDGGCRWESLFCGCAGQSRSRGEHSRHYLNRCRGWTRWERSCRLRSTGESFWRWGTGGQRDFGLPAWPRHRRERQFVCRRHR